MAVDYGCFQFASAPRTASTWFSKACSYVGLGETNRTLIHVPHTEKCDRLRVSIVRHPFTWLRSYYYALGGGSVAVPSVDVFSEIAKSSTSFQEFVRKYLTKFPGEVGRMMDSYNADTCLKLETIFWGTGELLKSVSIGDTTIKRALSDPPQNATKGMPLHFDFQLAKEVVEAESDYCSRYSYTISVGF